MFFAEKIKHIARNTKKERKKIMKKEMETVYKNKDNVVYTISNDLNSCYDIDVPDDVETVMLGIREDETIRTGALILAFNLVKSEKSFPNVKKLII